jgi:hypothetical protein
MKMNKTEWHDSHLFKIIGIILVVSYLVTTYVNNTRTINQLNRNGIISKAIVYEKKSIGGKGVILTKYYFKWKGKKYLGDSQWDDDIAIGDSLVIYFLESNPNINRSNTLLNK